MSSTKTPPGPPPLPWSNEKLAELCICGHIFGVHGDVLGDPGPCQYSLGAQHVAACGCHRFTATVKK